MHGSTRTIAAASLSLLILVSGCSSIVEAPKFYGGTRALLEQPFPITDASYKVGTARKRDANVPALVFMNLAWLIDFPLSAIADTLMVPIAYWVFDEGPPAKGGSNGAPPRVARDPLADELPALDGEGGGGGGDPLAPGG